MADQKIHILGQEDLVAMLGLLGLEGTIINSREEFTNKFNELIKEPTIGMIIIAMALEDELVSFLINFKLNNRSPFIFILPDIFRARIEEEGQVINKILEAIGDVLLS
ncbi:MAG: V-type ATP synthase subunit F [Candidatus Hermodarchaeota archaeon]